MLIEEQELFHAGVERYLNGDLGRIELRRFSHSRSAQPFYGGLIQSQPDSNYGKVMFGAEMGMYRARIGILMGNAAMFTEEARQGLHGKRLDWLMKTPEIEQRNYLVKLGIKLFNRAVIRLTNTPFMGVEGLYDWIENTGQEYYPIRCYLGVKGLRELEDNGIELDPDVSTELVRVRDKFPTLPSPSTTFRF